MAKYRKKPVVIEAVQWKGNNEIEIQEFIADGSWKWEADNGKINLYICTLEGLMIAPVGDWIIRGVNGEFYPCKPDIFEKTYEKLEEEEQMSNDIETPKTVADLTKIISDLLSQSHDYNGTVHAISKATKVTHDLMAVELGASGFQVSCSELEFLKQCREMELGFEVRDYSELMYPQYCNEREFKSWEDTIKENKEVFKEEAKKRIEKHKNGKGVHPHVMKHWEWLAKL